MRSTVSNVETVTPKQVEELLPVLAPKESVLLLGPPGVGKSETVDRLAAEAGLPCRSLLGTQIAPEDVSGVPRIIGERSVFCPPRVLLPEEPVPFCLFLDELPAASPDVQKALYPLLLERRLGEHRLPAGSWVVAAGNRAEDRALVRSMSSALVNRVLILQVRSDHREWLEWAKRARVRADVRAFIHFCPEALMRPVPADPGPFSTPRAWAALSRSMDLLEARGLLSTAAVRALAFGRVSAEDAAMFCLVAEERITDLRPIDDYLRHPELLPTADTERWFILSRIRQAVARDELTGYSPEILNTFLRSLPPEHRLALLVDHVCEWGRLGANAAMLDTLREVLAS